MLNKNTLVKIKNRDNGRVGYTIPDLGNLHRNFQAGEEKTITFEELQKLSWIPGGEYILKNYLVILEPKSAINELLGTVEPEYNYTETEIKYILEEGSIEQLEDCLEFAPDGVIELVKKLAVDMKIDSESKRATIFNKTGFNVTNAININSQTNEEDKEEKTERKAAPVNLNDNKEDKGRRAAPVYNVVTKK